MLQYNYEKNIKEATALTAYRWVQWARPFKRKQKVGNIPLHHFKTSHPHPSQHQNGGETNIAFFSLLLLLLLLCRVYYTISIIVRERKNENIFHIYVKGKANTQHNNTKSTISLAFFYFLVVFYSLFDSKSALCVVFLT